MNDERELPIVDADGVEDLIGELAQTIAPHVGDDTALLGILRRGKPLADMLADRLGERLGRKPEIGQLKLKRYSDDLELLHDRPHIDPDTLDIEVEDRHLILVDDVLYTGESMFRAASKLRAAGATHIQTAFLCARTGRKVPIHDDFVGCRFDIRPDWVIHCSVPPYENELGIVLAHQDAMKSQ